jgi:phosphate-selective porin OprO/OprP
VRLHRSFSLVALACLLLAGPALAQQPRRPKAPAPRGARGVRPAVPRAKAAAGATAAAGAKAAATPLAKLRAELDALKAQVESSRRDLAQVPVAMTALDQLTSELAAMRGAVERLAAMRSSESDLRRELDELRVKLHETRAEVGQLRVRVDQPPPEYPLPGGVGHDRRGFYLRTEDGTFELRLSGYVQAGYEGAYRTTGMPEETAGAYDQWRNLSAMNLRRAKLLLGGHLLRPELRYRVELDLARIYQGDGLVWHDQSTRLATLRSPLEDLWIEVAFRPWLVARVGQLRVPFGREHQIQESKLHLVDTSVVDRSFTFDRDVGLMLHGLTLKEHLGYQLAVLNGNGPNRLHDTGDLLYVARLLLAPLGPVLLAGPDHACGRKPHLTVGGSFAYRRARLDGGLGGLGGLAASGSLGQVAATTLDRVDIYQVGAELQGRWRRFTLAGELVWRRQRNVHDAVAVTFYPGKEYGADYWGAYGQAGYYFLRDTLEGVVRYAFAEPHGFGRITWEQQQLPRAVHEATLGLNYFYAGHNAKVMIDGSYLVERGVAALGTSTDNYPLYDRKSGRLRLILQLKF